MIPIAQRLRMTEVKDTDVALETIQKIDCKARGIGSEEVLRTYQSEIDKYLEAHNFSSLDKNGKAGVEREAKKIAYHVICKNLIDSHVLKRYVHNTFCSYEKIYCFRRVFAAKLALNSLLQYVFSVNDRSPSKFMFDINTGEMISLEFRFMYNNQGFLEVSKMPFRMTRNIQELVGKSFINGVFIPAMASGASAFSANEDMLRPALSLLLRDDIVAWYISKSQPRNDTKMQELERQLADRVTKNVALVQSRFEKLTPESPKGDSTTPPQIITPDGKFPEPIDSKIRKLVSFATSTDNLAIMPPSYRAWL